MKRKGFWVSPLIVLGALGVLWSCSDGDKKEGLRASDVLLSASISPAPEGFKMGSIMDYIIIDGIASIPVEKVNTTYTITPQPREGYTKDPLSGTLSLDKNGSPTGETSLTFFLTKKNEQDPSMRAAHKITFNLTYKGPVLASKFVSSLKIDGGVADPSTQDILSLASTTRASAGTLMVTLNSSRTDITLKPTFAEDYIQGSLMPEKITPNNKPQMTKFSAKRSTGGDIAVIYLNIQKAL